MALVNLGIALIVVASLALLVRAERRDVNAPGVSLLRCLFPAWRFFEAIEPGPMLSYRVAAASGEFGAWIPAAPPARRRLFLNAAGNLQLACQSLVEQFASELDSGSAQPVSYQLVQALVLFRIRAHTPPARYQFRLTERSPGEPELFRSPVHAL